MFFFFFLKKNKIELFGYTAVHDFYWMAVMHFPWCLSPAPARPNGQSATGEVTWPRDKSSQPSPFIQLPFVSALDNFPISLHMEGCCSSISQENWQGGCFYTPEMDAKNAQEIQRPRDKWSSSLKGSKRQMTHLNTSRHLLLCLDGLFSIF